MAAIRQIATQANKPSQERNRKLPNAFSLRRITSPLLPSTVLHRPSLVAMLNEAIVGTSAVVTGRTGLYRVVLLCAPAGYGKTTLLADFADHTDIPCCWCFLDPVDADVIAFLELLLASIRHCFPQFNATIDSQLASAISADTDWSLIPYRLEAVIDKLVAAIATEIPERFALILCNYHEINQTQVINHLVNRLISRLPTQCILILESRAIPALEFAPLLARREMIGLGSNELRFTAQEICDLAKLQEVDPLSEAEAVQMAQSFDGWITGILLSTRLGDLQSSRLRSPFSSAWGSPAMRMDRQHLFAYLVNEVFTCEPDAYAFLKEAVVLRQMTPSLCAALLDIPDASVLLGYLEQQGLFVSRCGDGPGKYYICQPMLRELLYDELRTTAPVRFATLHRRAADLFHATQDDDQAIYHSLAAAAYDTAANLIVSTCKQMLDQGHSTTLAYWIDALPTEITMHHPQLLLARANIFLSAGEYGRVRPLLDAVSAVIKQDSDEGPVLLAEILIARGTVQFQRGDYSGAHDLCRQALAMLPVDEGALRAEAYLRLGVCACLLGNFTDGIVQLRRALQLCGCGMETRQTARLHSALANAYGMLGHHTLSEHHRTRAVRCWEHLNDEWGKIDNLVGLGVTKQRQGEFTEAEHLFFMALTAACGNTHYQRGEAYARVSLGDLYQDQNCYQQALSTFEDGFTLARQLGDTYLTNYTVRALATTYLLMGDPQTALALISQADQETAYCETLSYCERALRKVTLGAILLQQQRYSEAYAHLITAEATLHTAGLKREQLQAMIRIAACLLGQGDAPASLGRMKEAVALARQSGYELLMAIELRRTPDLLHAMQSMPETAHLCALLCEEDGVLAPPGLPLLSPVLTVSTQDRSTIRVLALGEPIVFLNDVPVTRWRMARAMELCFYLLNAARPLHKEQIMAALWPDVDGQIDQTLRSTFYYLRKVLGKSCISSRCSTYMLDLATVYNNVWYDVTAFQQHYVSAQAALSMKDDTVAGTAFQEMTHLYQGDYGQSFYSDWCTTRRDELKNAYIDAHHQLALIAWRQRQLDESILHWQHLLTMDSCLEEAHYGLMRCYLQQGKRGLALRQYQRCAESLRDELGTTPGHTIQRLIGI